MTLAQALYPLLDELAAPDDFTPDSRTASVAASSSGGGSHKGRRSGSSVASDDTSRLPTSTWMRKVLDDMRRDPSAAKPRAAANVKKDANAQQRGNGKQANTIPATASSAPSPVPSKTPGSARRRVTKSDDWEAEWDKEDAAVKDVTTSVPSSGEKSSVSLLEELTRILSKDSSISSAKSKGKKSKRKSKKRKADASASAASGNNIGTAQDEEISIEDVD